jgi:hypothetical protein
MTVHHAITWAHMLALEHGGHDKFLPALANDELRFTMASIREAFAVQVGDVARRGEQDRQALLTTLERVRAAVFDTNLTHVEVCMAARYALGDRPGEALASQPEAPACGFGMCGTATECNLCGRAPGQLPRHQPEAPKGQEDEDTGNCTVCTGPVYYGSRHSKCGRLENDLADATARIAEQANEIARITREHFERGLTLNRLCLEKLGLLEEVNAANARADAAERRVEEWAEAAESMHETGYEQLQAAKDAKDKAEGESERNAQRFHDLSIKHHRTATERDQLAARVKEWESAGRDVGIDCPGAMQQAKGVAVAACEALGLKYEETAPADLKAIQAGVCLRDVVGCDSLHHALESGAMMTREEHNFVFAHCGVDTCTHEERAVLEASSKVEILTIADGGGSFVAHGTANERLAKAELANRAAKAKREEPPHELNGCDHKFIGTKNCVKCGWVPPAKAKRGGQ